MSIYTSMQEQNWYGLENKLKPITCESCKADGNFIGECPQCLENQAWNREWMETHTFITDTEFRCYHESSHSYLKQMPLRLPNEHPFLYYGIELEVEFDDYKVQVHRVADEDDYSECDEDDENWRINEILNDFSKITDGLFIYEADGSLANGVEFISRPCSYAFWKSESTVKMLKEGLEFLRSKGAMVTQPDSNGMHIHISKKFFDFGEATRKNPQLAYEGFDWLFQKFQPELEKLGGRKYTQYCESRTEKLKRSLNENNWCLHNYAVDAEIKCTLKKGGIIPRGDHYSAVNSTPKTIEARIFKSTTDYKEVLANIELVRNFAHAVRDNEDGKTLNGILHTKDNMFLDEHIDRVRRLCRKNKVEFDLEKVDDSKIEICEKVTN